MPRQALGAWLLLVFSLHAPGMLCPLAAQEAGPASYVHRAWTAEDGLPQNSVTALARTQDGYLWVGTLKGLARFDGMHFITFEAATTEGLESDRISSLLEDHTGTLWIRTEEGRLSSYWAGHFTAYADMGVVLRLYEDQQGVLWIGTSNGLLRREGTRLTRFTMQDGLPGNRTSALMEDRAGTLWILTDGGLVQRKNGRFTVPPLLVGEAVSALAEQADGSLWLNTKGGIRHISNDQVADYPLPGLSIRDLVVGRSDRVWVLTNGQGLLHFTGQGFAPFDMQEEVAGTTVHALLEDEDGLLWVGTRSSGLHRFQERLFNAYTQDDGLPADVIHAVMEDRQGAIWAGTYDGGVARLAEGRITIYSAKEGLPNNSIFAISEDREGTIWATSSGHAFAHFDGSRFVVPPPATTHATQRGRGIAAAFVPGHTLWQIHKEGVFQQRNEALTQVLDYSFQPLPWPLFEDHKGRLWLNHSERLCYVEQEQLICPVEQGATAPIRTLHEPADDTYWLGTYGSGLCQLRHTQLTCLNKMHGLPDNTVHRILEDDFGYVWLSSNKGIARIARRDLMAFFDGSANRIYPDLYGTADGMPSNECNGGTYPAGWKARDGRLWFPTMKGLAVVDPTRALQQATRPPPVHIENVSVDGVVVSSMEAGAPVLPAGSDRIVFRYTAPYLQASEKLRFRYRLEGHDDVWVEAGDARTATYTNLAPGRYQLLVETAIGSGAWQDGTRLPFRLAPHFYQTPWFAALGVLGVFLLLAAVYQALVRRLIEREWLHQSEEETHRLAALDAAKSRFFANISHEFRPPLTVILGATDQLAQNEASGEQIGHVRRNANRLLQLINQLLDLSKLETDRLKLDPRPGDLVAFLQVLVRSMQPLAERQRVDLHLRAEAEPLLMLFDSDALEKVFGNLLSNALKFTPEGGKVWVTVERRMTDEGPLAEIIFKDTGPGIPRDAIPTIFDRFAQVNDDETRAHEGTDIGLALAKALVELHGGKILVESEVGLGSAFLVRLPFVAFSGEKDIVDKGISSGLSGQEERFGKSLGRVDGKSQTEAPKSQIKNQKPQILLVEDNAEVRALVRTYLESTYHILEAADGEAGLKAAKEHKPALILSDVMMPRMDGYALCQAIKANDQLRHIPVVLLTALAAEEDAVAGLEAGADDYIAKPFSASALRARIANLIASRQHLRSQFSQELVVQPAGIVVSSEEEVFLQEVLTVVTRRMDETRFGVDALAEDLGRSRRNLERRLKAVTGQTPAELIRQMRLERAAQLLAAHSSTIAEVAYAVGYKSPSHFSQAFREAFGVSPSEHIEKAS